MTSMSKFPVGARIHLQQGKNVGTLLPDQAPRIIDRALARPLQRFIRPRHYHQLASAQSDTDDHGLVVQTRRIRTTLRPQSA